MPDSVDTPTEAILHLAHEFKELEQRAIMVYEPIVDAIVTSRSSDVRQSWAIAPVHWSPVYTTVLLPDRWKTAHPKATREYREQERRDKADTAVAQATRRRGRSELRKVK